MRTEQLMDDAKIEQNASLSSIHEDMEMTTSEWLTDNTLKKE